MKLRITVAVVLAYAAVPMAGAQSWPSKPVRMLVSVPAGGTPDVVARMVTPGLSAMLGQQLVVDNRGGASGQIGAELAARATPDGYTLFSGMNITHVPYKGAPQAVTDVIGGNMHMTLNSIPPVIQHVKAGRLRLLGVSSARRSPQLPEVPTIGEAGVPGYEFITWFGMLAPAGTPKDIIARLHSTLVKVVHAPESRAQFKKLGYDTVAGTPAEFASHLRNEYEKYGKIVKLIGAKVD
jgi:tripartite-type tricarboxylate transporter receptor subunit TctC